MRFKQQPTVKLPQIDLIPMLNVMMGILAFFVMITMTLSSEQFIDVQLPAQSPEATPPKLPTNPFMVELVGETQVLVNGEPMDLASGLAQTQRYLNQSPDHVVYVLPGADLPYEQVVQFLGEMRSIGGDRVSLATMPADGGVTQPGP